jgi:hypothetical protein
LVALVGMFYAEEDWRGHREWNQYRQAKEARGEHLDFRAYVPKPVPDEENFAATPIGRSFFQDNFSIFANDLYSRADDHVYRTNNNKMANAKAHRQFADLVAWQMAFVALQAGALKPHQQFETDKTDLQSREEAAPTVLAGLEPAGQRRIP